MRYQDIRKLLRRKPFRPFTIHTTDGVAYEIRHPELVLQGKRFVSIGIVETPEAGNGEADVPDIAVDIDLLHVVRVEREAGSQIEGEEEDSDS